MLLLTRAPGVMRTNDCQAKADDVGGYGAGDEFEAGANFSREVYD